MYEFTSNFTSLLCCIPFKRSKRSRDAPSDLRTFQPPASTLSVPLPYNTVPHSSSESHTEDARALHHIFSSSSSIRGYQTAATTPAYLPTSRPSLDLEFKFGTSSSSPQRSTTRIEQLGHHIRQRLSEGRLSKASSRRSKQETDAQEPALIAIPEQKRSPEYEDPPAVTSQSSVGLSEILASGNASRAGYDSDAKSIDSPVLSSVAGTIKVGSGFVKHALENLEPHLQPSEAPQPSSVSSPCVKDAQHVVTTHTKGQSSPFPTSPKRTSFADALQMGKAESPKDLLRRLSAGIADGTIKTPDTPELRAARLPSIKEVDSDWRLPAPKRSSSLPRQQNELQTKLRQLGEAAKSISNEARLGNSEDDKRTSLISELDPTLLDYVDRYSQRYSSDSVRRASLDDGKVADAPQNTIDESIKDTDPPPTAKAMSSPNADRDSVHLFNMRISQRLASRSRIPVTSPTSSVHASTHSLMLGDEQNMVPHSTREGGRWSGPVMREHIRRPSDPRTRALFENALGSRDPSRSWKTVTPAASTSSYAGMVPTMVSQNASSCYLSDEAPDGQTLNDKAASFRRRSQPNPHSLAMGGRSVSVNLSTSHSDRKVRHLSPADSGWSQQVSLNNPRSSEDSWEAPTRVYQRGRSISMPSKHPQRQHVSPTPQPKRFCRVSDNAENLRKISLQDILDRRNERMTEISVQALAIRRDEQFSEIDHTMLPTADGSVSRRSGDGLN